MTRQLIQEFASRPDPKRSKPVLLEASPNGSSRFSVQVARGLSNLEIAEELNISPSTAKTHVSRVLMKLDARDRAQLVVIAYETGLVASG